MGKRIKRKTYKLSFQPDTDLDGLVVVVRSLSLGQAIQVRGGVSEGESVPEAMAKVLAEHLVEWNAEDEDGVPIPTTLEGILTQDASFTMEIIDAWQNAVAAVPAPLPQTSTGGQPSVEASIPMEVLSESLAS